MSGSHHAPEPPRDSRYPKPDEGPGPDLTAGLEGLAARDQGHYSGGVTAYDCRTATERERAELDVLRLEYETLREANAYQSRRMTTLEATVAALEDVVSQHVLACNIKSIVLRMEDDGR